MPTYPSIPSGATRELYGTGDVTITRSENSDSYTLDVAGTAFTLTTEMLRESMAAVGRRGGRTFSNSTQTLSELFREVYGVDMDAFANYMLYGGKNKLPDAPNSPIVLGAYGTLGKIHFDEEYI